MLNPRHPVPDVIGVFFNTCLYVANPCLWVVRFCWQLIVLCNDVVFLACLSSPVFRRQRVNCNKQHFDGCQSGHYCLHHRLWMLQSRHPQLANSIEWGYWRPVNFSCVHFHFVHLGKYFISQRCIFSSVVYTLEYLQLLKSTYDVCISVPRVGSCASYPRNDDDPAPYPQRQTLVSNRRKRMLWLMM